MGVTDHPPGVPVHIGLQWSLHLLHAELHWLDVTDRVTYKLGLTVYKCLHGRSLDYLSELCTTVTQMAERQHLRSASRHLLIVPMFQTDMYGHRAFSVAGSMTWNLICDDLRDHDLSIDSFQRNLNIFLIRTILCTLGAIEALCDYVL